MSTPAQQYLTSFARRATQRLAALARELAGALAGGDESTTAQLTHEGQLLTHGLRSCGNPSNQLSDSQRVYIAGKLLPLLRDYSGSDGANPVPAPALTLALNALSGRVAGAPDSTPLLVSGRTGGPVPAGTVLLLSRDGVQLLRQVLNGPGPYQFTDPAPGARYRAELVGTALYAERQRLLVAGVRLGTRPHGATAAQLAALPLLHPDFVNGTASCPVSGARNRVYLCVPTSTGRVAKLTQPNDGDANITAAFSHTAQLLDFGPDGTYAYDVLESSADFLGDFLFEAHLG